MAYELPDKTLIEEAMGTPPQYRTGGEKAAVEWLIAARKLVKEVDHLEEKDPDFRLTNHGTIFLLLPLNATAEDWLTEHISEDAQYLGNAVAIEHRFVADITTGIEADGLTIG